MSDEWLREPLGEIAEVIMGQSPPSSTYNVDGKGLPFFQGKAEFGDIYPTPVKYCSKPQRIAQPNDILMSVRAPVGPVNLSPSECCIGRGLSAIRGKRHKIDQTYLFYYLRSMESALSKFGQGSTFGAIGRRDVERIEIPHPASIKVQQRIADILKRVHRLLGKRLQANQLADKILQSTFLEMFGDKEPQNKVGDVATFVSSGSTPLGGENTYVENGIVFIREQNVLMNELDLQSVAHITEETHRKMRRTWVKNGDVLLNITGASLGRVAVYRGPDDKANVNQHVCIIRLDRSKALPEYVASYLATSRRQKQIWTIQAGASRQALNFQQVKSLGFYLPDLKEQERFADVVRRIKSLKGKQKRSTQEINELFHSLMHKAFRGQLSRVTQEYG
jgi:type I restriction enzyme S subunit